MSVASVLSGESRWAVVQGDARRRLQEMPAGVVHCVVTSPPYYQVRDYSLPPTVWAGNTECAHDLRPALAGRRSLGAFCTRCGAWSGCLGLEPTPELFVGHLVDVFREVRRVLRDDGVCWLNIGDSYWAGGSTTAYGQDTRNFLGGCTLSAPPTAGQCERPVKPRAHETLTAGDLIGIPQRLFLALQADGWVVRAEVIWEKPSAMPESVSGWTWQRCRRKVTSGGGKRDGLNGSGRAAHGATISDRGRDAQWEPCPGCPKCETTDGLVLRRGSWRPTRAHEQILQLTKDMDYFSDGQAVAELAVSTAPSGNGFRRPHRIKKDGRGSEKRWEVQATRNARSVWRIQSRPFGTAELGVDAEHYATFPPELVERCILASASEAGCCRNCGAPWARIVDRQRTIDGEPADLGAWRANGSDGRESPTSAQGIGHGRIGTSTTTLGFRPTCKCAGGGG